ncbi:MAG: T9SS type A sorting domain-containing protein [Bacteroidota bacterium]
MNRKFYWIVCTVFALLVQVDGWAQGNYVWSNLGPDNTGSTTRALAFDGNGNLLAGSQGGGLWISRNEGISWEPVDSYDRDGGNPNITSIAVDGNTIYVATGATKFTLSYYVTDLNTGNYDFRDQPEGFKGYIRGLPGGGVYKSTDGGGSWSAAAATNTADTRNYKGPFSTIQKVFINDGRVFVATGEGLYYSDDGLATIQKSSGSPAFENAIVFDVEAGTSNKIFAGTHNPDGNIRDSLYVSTDNGASFVADQDEILFSVGQFSFNGVRIATAPSNPDVIYVGTTAASQGLNAIFRTDDNGESWSLYSGPGGSQGFLPVNRTGRDAFVLEVFPDNENEVIVAGFSWFTFKEAEGWVNTASHTSPVFNTYIPRNQQTVLFDPNNPEKLYVGTNEGIVRSDDRALTFSLKNKGYESMTAYSVAAIGLEGNEAVIAGTGNQGTIYNRNYATSLPSNQAFGQVSTRNFGEIAASYTYPGALISEGNDDGIERSINFGESFDAFYGTTTSPQVAGLTVNPSDSVIDRPNANAEGVGLFDAGGSAQAPFILDEYIPENVIDDASLSKEELRAAAPNYVFFASKQYVWVVNGPLGDGLQVKWNRLTDPLVNGITEFLTTITVSNDEDHTVYVASSQGNIWRITNGTDLTNYDASVDVVQLNSQPSSGLAGMNGRWISAIAVDPQNSDRVVITYSAYGGDLSALQSLVWITNTANTNPVFGVLPDLNSGDNAHQRPFYSAKFVQDPGNANSVLMLGNESGLYSVTDIAGQPPFFQSNWTSELPDLNVPVYDIEVRDFVSRITDEESQDFVLSRDNTVFVATHGRGIWSTTSLQFNRDGRPVEPVEISDIAISLFPNPHKGQAVVSVSLPEDGQVSLEIVDISGKVLELSNPTAFAAGEHEINLDLRSYSEGMYFIKVNVQSGIESYSQILKAVRAD